MNVANIGICVGLLSSITLHIVPTRVTDEVRCRYSRRTFCTQTECKPIPLGSAYLLSPPLSELQDATMGDDRSPAVQLRRCDNEGCTPVEVVVRWDGAFLDVTAPSSGYVAKFYQDTHSEFLTYATGDFVEVATLMLGTEISYGHCPFRSPN